MFREVEVCEMKGLVLIAGLSKAGKSTFADNFCRSIPQSTHVPLDKYFKEVPQGLTFLRWVQSPDSIDWILLREHIELLKSGHDCYTPVLDWRRTGRRVTRGGLKGHDASRIMTGGARYYVIPGCFAFKLPNPDAPVVRVYIDTPRSIIETRRQDLSCHDLVPPDGRESDITEQIFDAHIVCTGTERHDNDVKEIGERIVRALEEQRMP